MNFSTKIFVLLLIFQFIFYCTGNSNDDKFKSPTIAKIARKVRNITMVYLSNIPLEKRLTFVKIFKEKLNRSAISLGAEGPKHVNILMYQVNLIAHNSTKLLKSGTLLEPTENTFKSLNKTKINRDTSNLNKNESQMIIDITNKIKSLAEVYFKSDKMPEERKQLLDTIKKKILESTNKKHALMHSKFEKMKYYVDFIAQKLDSIMKINIRNDTRRMEIESYVSKDVNLTRKNFDTVGSITNKIDDDSDCTIITDKICSQLYTLESFTCSHEDKSIPLEKLCNDVSDCPDESDEKDCSQQGIDKVYRAISTISQIYTPPNQKCFVLQLGSSVLTRQNVDLRNFLQIKLKFIEKHRNISSLLKPTNTKENINNYVMKKSVNEMAVAVNTVAVALEGTLCSRRKSIQMHDQLRELTTVLNVTERKELWSPGHCECSSMMCSNVNCQDPCPKICMQKNSLNHWICEATDGNLGVPISVLCDGKIDCYDKTDETNCSYGAASTKFQAREYFYEILHLIKQKSVSQEFLPVQYKLLALHDSVIHLQKLSVSKNVDNDMLKEARDRCFSILISIYEYVLFKSESQKHLDHNYQFLNALKDKLIRVLKLTNTRIVKLRNDECFCIAGRCGTINCSKICTKACLVHPKLTRYYCGSTNTTVPLDLICDGKPDCPNGKDEVDCKQDVCRKHHLLLIRYSLESTGYYVKGTTAGEALLAWKAKAKSLVKLAENEKLSSPLIRKVVGDILQELVTTYGSIDDFRRSVTKSRQLLKQLTDISQKIINTVKNCGNKN